MAGIRFTAAALAGLARLHISPQDVIAGLIGTEATLVDQDSGPLQVMIRNSGASVTLLLMPDEDVLWVIAVDREGAP